MFGSSSLTKPLLDTDDSQAFNSAESIHQDRFYSIQIFNENQNNLIELQQSKQDFAVQNLKIIEEEQQYETIPIPVKRKSEVINLQQHKQQRQNTQIYQPAAKSDRLQEIKNYKYIKNKKARQIYVDTDLSTILLRDMRQNKNILYFLAVSVAFDTLVRFNNLIFVVLLYSHNLQLQTILEIIAYTYLITRFFNLLCQIKLMTVNVQKNYTQLPLQLAILYQQNFSDKDLEQESKQEWIGWNQKVIDKSYIGKKILFYLLPTEISILGLQYRTDETSAIYTYLTAHYILRTIENLIFYPIFIVCLYYISISQKYDKKINIYYRNFTIILIFIVVLKYWAIAFVFVIKRIILLNYLKIRD